MAAICLIAVIVRELVVSNPVVDLEALPEAQFLRWRTFSSFASDLSSPAVRFWCRSFCRR